MTFSTKSYSFPNRVIEDLETDYFSEHPTIANIINKNGFKINKEKIHLRMYFERQEVTGLIVNKNINIKREYIKNIRSKLYQLKTKGYEASNKRFIEITKNKNGCIKKHLKGAINFIGMVRGSNDFIYSKMLLELYNIDIDLFSKKEIDEKIIPKIEISKKLGASIIIIEDSSPKVSTAFFTKKYGWTTAAHCIEKGPFTAYYPSNPQTKYPVLVHKVNQELDLALLNIPTLEDPLEYLETNVADRKTHPVGSKVKIIGFPDHGPGKITYTQISSEVNNYISYSGLDKISFSGGIQAGMSGGPIIDDNNRVIGINHKGKGSTDDENVPYLGIPISALDKI